MSAAMHHRKPRAPRRSVCRALSSSAGTDSPESRCRDPNPSPVSDFLLLPRPASAAQMLRRRARDRPRPPQAPRSALSRSCRPSGVHVCLAASCRHSALLAVPQIPRTQSGLPHPREPCTHRAPGVRLQERQLEASTRTSPPGAQSGRPDQFSSASGSVLIRRWASDPAWYSPTTRPICLWWSRPLAPGAGSQDVTPELTRHGATNRARQAGAGRTGGQ